MARAKRYVLVEMVDDGLDREFEVDRLPKFEWDHTYYIVVSEESLGYGGMDSKQDWLQVHAKSAAEAIRRVLRRSKYNDGRFNVGSIEIKKMDG